MASADLVLHPVRLRILQAFLGDRRLTTAELAVELADIPPASLYRHVARLAAAGVLAVVAEQPVRGALERTYALRVAAAAVDTDDLATLSPDDHRQAFLAYVAGLLGAFDRYTAGGDVDLVRDGVSYGMTALWLDDTELTRLREQLQDLFAPVLANTPTPGRTRRILGTVLLPAGEA